MVGARRTISAQELATELVDSTERMSKLVKAIKTYAYMDRGERRASPTCTRASRAR